MGGNRGLIPIVIVIVIMYHFFTNCFGDQFDIRLIFLLLQFIPTLFVLLQNG